MRNITLKFCAMLLAFCTSTIQLQAMDEWDGVTIAKGFYSGTGTKTNPYRIFTASQFLYFIQQTKEGKTFEGQYVELCNDISFKSDAIEGGNFYGDFDGNDHIIQVDEYWSVSGWTLFNLYGSMHDVQFVRANEVMTIYTGGILYNCKFEFPSGYHGNWTVYLEGGTIANCVSNSAYYKNSSKYGGASGFVGGDYQSNGYCSNCYFPITSYSYGGSLASNYRGITESCGEEAGNDWVQSHTERAYKSWPLTFNPTYQDYNVTITYVDECGLVSYDTKTYLANSTIGELPVPDVDNTFLGWKYNGTYVQSTDVITHDMVLYADWKHEIKVQPTIYEPYVLCNDKEHATYQWYYQNKLPLQLENLSSGSSNVEITIPEDNLVLSFDFTAYGYTASGYSGDDEEAWIRVDGEEIVSVYHNKSGSYSCVLSAGTHTITRTRSSLSNICISYPTETLVDETSSTLHKQTIMNRPGAYFCKVTYSNNGDELISDYVNYEKLLTIDNVTYVVNEDSTATVLWVADMAVDITIPKTVNYNGVDNPVTSISSKAFVDCTSLASIKCETPDAPTLLCDTTFEGLTGVLNLSNVTLYVPSDSEPTYSSADGWKSFINIVGFTNAYKATFHIDGEVVATYNIKEGDVITYPTEYNKEGYSLIWDTNIDIMPSYDITINGTFSVNSYTVTYIVDGKTYATDSIAYGCEIVLRDEPTKEGHTFGGWSEIPSTMPAEDITINGTFSVNSYTVTYIVDGKTYATDSIAYGCEIVLRDEPTKEGHTFGGWSEAPETMSTEDIVISGSFILNRYTVTFIIDGEVYQSTEIEYGAEIPTIEVPTKNGRKFSGWSEIPSTMPAENVIVEGKFCYTIIFMVDGKYYSSSEIYYGNDIKVPSETPHKTGHTFVEWDDLPCSMPARDMTILENFSVNKYQLIFIIDSEVYETLHLEDGSEIEYPQKEGYIITWETENLPETMPDENLIIIGTATLDTGVESIKVDSKENIVYTIDGQRLENVNNLERDIYIINGKKTVIY